jgi:hypothetical protein
MFSFSFLPGLLSGANVKKTFFFVAETPGKLYYGNTYTDFNFNKFTYNGNTFNT